MLQIHSEHTDWLVVEKPSGMLIHPTRPEGPRTLWHELNDQFRNEKLSIINRLDRETSGLVLVSRNSSASTQLGKMTMNRLIAKEYMAIVLGQTPSQGIIEAPLDRLGKYRPSPIYLKQGVIESGSPAKTSFETLQIKQLANGPMISLLRVQLETGRLHQIRVHLSHIGHPVIGDKIYGPDENCYLEFIETGWTPQLQEKLWLPRHALHANQMSFQWQEQPYLIHSPLPEDLATFWATSLHVI